MEIGRRECGARDDSAWAETDVIAGGEYAIIPLFVAFAYVCCQEGSWTNHVITEGAPLRVAH